MLLNIPTCNKINIVNLKDFGEPGDKVQDEETKIQHLVPRTILVYTTVKNKTKYNKNIFIDKQMDYVLGGDRKCNYILGRDFNT